MKRIAILLTFVAANAFAGELQNIGAVLKAPLRWRATEWKRFGEGVALVVAVAAVDKPVIDAVQRNRFHFSDQFARRITPLGGHDAVLASVALFGSGLLLHDQRLRGAGRDSLESEFIAAMLVTPALKRAFGRSRPFLNEGTYHFEPGKGNADAHESFPSGHATNAFAAATAIAGHYDNWIVPTIVYSIATGVSMARVNDNVHFPSDVIAGALIGRAIGKGILARHHVTIVPQKNGFLLIYRRAGE
jgi:membrane-associated phospholipid phosphatase